MKKIDLGKMIAQTTKSTFVNNKLISDENVKKNIQILEELRVLIPPLGVDEFSLLEQNIIKNGCRDAITLWETQQKFVTPDTDNPEEPAYVLVDGHNRFEICQKNNLNFSVQLMAFDSFQQVKDYMIDLQLGRRNLSPEQISYFRGLRFLNEKNESGKYSRKNHGVHNEPHGLIQEKGRTAERLAKEYNVGTSTIKRDAQFAEGLSKMEPQLRNEILIGKKKVDKKMVQSLAKLTTAIDPIRDISQLEQLVNDTTQEDAAVKSTTNGLKEWINTFSEKTEQLYTTRSKEDFDALKKTLEEYGAYLGVA
jgi:hypothetical protein